MDANEYETSLVPPLPSFNVNVWGVVASWDVPKRVRVCPSSDREALVFRLVVQAFRKSSIGDAIMVVLNEGFWVCLLGLKRGEALLSQLKRGDGQIEN